MNVLVPDLRADEQSWTPNQFMKLTNRSKATVYRWLREGTLPAFGYRLYKDATGHWHIIGKKVVKSS